MAFRTLPFALLIALTLATAHAAPDDSRAPAGEAMPQERQPHGKASPALRRALQRADLCEHLAGEFNGDRSPRDKEINAEMGRQKCGTVERDLRALRAK